MSKGKSTVAERVEVGALLAVILAELGCMAKPYSLAFFESVEAAVERFIAWEVALPGWMFVTLCLVAGAVVVGIVSLCMLLVKPKLQRAVPLQPPLPVHFVPANPDPPLVHQKYERDLIDGIVWHWRYSSEGVLLLNYFCPVCHAALAANHGWFEGRTYFFCATCKRDFGPFDGSVDVIWDRTKIQIDNRIRNGDWKTTIL